jgi:hypothetical protein
MVTVYDLTCLSHLRHFVAPGLAFGEGDATGEGLTAGLGLTAGALPASPLGDGEVEGEGLRVFGEFDSLAESVAQPTANTVENIIRPRSAMRLNKFTFGVVISFSPRFSKIEKRDDDCSGGNL